MIATSYPSAVQAAADLLLVILTGYTVLSARSGGLRRKRDRDRRMDEFLDGYEGDSRFGRVASAPERLQSLEKAVSDLERTVRGLVRQMAELRNEFLAAIRAGNSAARIERDRIAAREKRNDAQAS